ncbi:Ferric-chelate reductase 1 [Cricetulus griseus]|uniref:Ferric-chelate reductase 1 n=1 Tax=Cricetulus griseus TaxID=10029 RepID=G3IIJ8_CRIGR|nr:Ferric-chelate reductase 1 [Cricetulus griseus]
MAAPEFTVSALVFVLLICSVAGYPSGKVVMSCGGMIPQHGHRPQSEPVHQITVSQMKFKPGDQIQVTLSGPQFRGFLLEARDAEDLSGPPVGSFTLIDSEVSQLLTCEDVQGSAVSHTSPSKKTEIKVYWNAPSSAPNHIQFLVTVVEKYKIYWVKIPSHIISQPNAPTFTTPKATTQPMTTSPSVSQLTKPFSASECGNKKFCVRSPLNCDPESEPACVFLSFTRDDQTVMVEMSGPSEGYLSFAFSHDRWMGDDDAYLCIREDQTVYIRPSYLTGRSYPVMESTRVSVNLLGMHQVHRILMLATSVLTCIAFVMPFVYRGGWSRHAGYHPYLGCTVMTLAVLQPLLATFRPPLHDPRRQVFNWTHWSVGTAARIIAVAAMFLGMDLPGLNLPSPQKTYAMMGFVVWHIGTEVLLEIHAYRLSRKVEILDDDRIQILQSLTVAEAEVRFSSLVD